MAGVSARASGAFKIISTGRGATLDGSNSTVDFEFNAGYSNSIYGKANTVQPPMLQLIPQLKDPYSYVMTNARISVFNNTT